MSAFLAYTAALAIPIFWVCFLECSRIWQEGKNGKYDREYQASKANGDKDE